MHKRLIVVQEVKDAEVRIASEASQPAVDKPVKLKECLPSEPPAKTLGAVNLKVNTYAIYS